MPGACLGGAMAGEALCERRVGRRPGRGVERRPGVKGGDVQCRDGLGLARWARRGGSRKASRLDQYARCRGVRGVGAAESLIHDVD